MKLHLAPIQGMTIAPYRNAYDEIFGCIDTYYSPFIATSDPTRASAKLFKDIIPDHNNSDINLVPQLLGNKGSDFNHFTGHLVELGYREINWNIGCPYPMVTKKKKGSGIMPHPDMVKTFLDMVVNDALYDLSVKMRLGLDDISEGIKIIEILNDYPLKSVTIHGRIGTQKYTGRSDIEGFKTLSALCKHEIIYNGDIYTVKDFLKVQGQLPDIEHFMIGRGALENPFLASEIKGIIVENKTEKLKIFHSKVFTYYQTVLSGDRHLLDRMKEFWRYTGVSLDPTGQELKKMQKCKTIVEYNGIVNKLLEQ